MRSLKSGNEWTHVTLSRVCTALLAATFIFGRDCCARTGPPVRALGWAGAYGSTYCSLRSIRTIRAFSLESPKVSNNNKKSLDLSLAAFLKRVARGV